MSADPGECGLGYSLGEADACEMPRNLEVRLVRCGFSGHQVLELCHRQALRSFTWEGRRSQQPENQNPSQLSPFGYDNSRPFPKKKSQPQRSAKGRIVGCSPRGLGTQRISRADAIRELGVAYFHDR